MLAGVPLPDGRAGEERQAVPQTAAAEHPDHHAANLALRRRFVCYFSKITRKRNKKYEIYNFPSCHLEVEWPLEYFILILVLPFLISFKQPC